jgi:hypothetical protein
MGELNIGGSSLNKNNYSKSMSKDPMDKFLALLWTLFIGRSKPVDEVLYN